MASYLLMSGTQTMLFVTKPVLSSTVGPAFALAVLYDGGLALFDDLARDALALSQTHVREVVPPMMKGGVYALVAL